jgi:hypothetical protein
MGRNGDNNAWNIQKFFKIQKGVMGEGESHQGPVEKITEEHCWFRSGLPSSTPISGRSSSSRW